MEAHSAEAEVQVASDERRKKVNKKRTKSEGKVRFMENYEIRVFPKLADDGSTYWTACYPSVPGCVGGGDTLEKAISDAQENLSVYLEYLQEEKSKREVKKDVRL